MKLEQLIKILEDAKENGKEEVNIKTSSGASWEVDNKNTYGSITKEDDKTLTLWLN